MQFFFDFTAPRTNTRTHTHTRARATIFSQLRNLANFSFRISVKHFHGGIENVTHRRTNRQTDRQTHVHTTREFQQESERITEETSNDHSLATIPSNDPRLRDVPRAKHVSRDCSGPNFRFTVLRVLCEA